MPSDSEQDDVRQRIQALSAAQQPILGWIAGARALALLSAAIEGGILKSARTPRTVAAIAGECGIATDRAVDICAALEAHEILDRVGDTYRLAEPFALLASSEALLPLHATVARGVAEAHLLEAIARPGHAYARLLPGDLLAMAQGDSVNPISPLRWGLTFLAQPELQHLFGVGARHLELGCGVGGGILSILNTYPNVTAVGVELEADLLAVARRRAESLGVADRVEWRQGDARNIDDEAAFDTAAWSQYYFPADTRAATLAAAFRALKPEGYLLVSMLPDPPASESDLKGAAGRAYSAARLLYGAWGIPVRTADDLRTEVEAGGFTFVRILQSPQRGRLLAQRPPA
jgi:SAM-dependent methyltransferase